MVSPQGGQVTTQYDATSVMPGRVVEVSRNFGATTGYGGFVKVQHPDGTFTGYGHLDSVDVKVGDDVEMGTPLGSLGSTGVSRGAHLDVQFYDQQNNRVNPETLGYEIIGQGTRPSLVAPVNPLGPGPVSNIFEYAGPFTGIDGPPRQQDPIPQTRPDPNAPPPIEPVPSGLPYAGVVTSTPALDQIEEALQASPPTVTAPAPAPEPPAPEAPAAPEPIDPFSAALAAQANPAGTLSSPFTDLALNEAMFGEFVGDLGKPALDPNQGSLAQLTAPNPVAGPLSGLNVPEPKPAVPAALSPNQRVGQAFSMFAPDPVPATPAADVVPAAFSPPVPSPRPIETAPIPSPRPAAPTPAAAPVPTPRPAVPSALSPPPVPTPRPFEAPPVPTAKPVNPLAGVDIPSLQGLPQPTQGIPTIQAGSRTAPTAAAPTGSSLPSIPAGPTAEPGFVAGMAPNLINQARAQGITPNPGMELSYNNLTGTFTQVPAGRGSIAGTGPGIFGFMERDLGYNQPAQPGGFRDRFGGFTKGAAVGGAALGPLGGLAGGALGAMAGNSGISSFMNALFGGFGSFGSPATGFSSQTNTEPSETISQESRDIISGYDREGRGGLF